MWVKDEDVRETPFGHDLCTRQTIPYSQVVPIKSEIIVDDNGSKFWFNANGVLHRKDGPAVEFADGSKEWYVGGKILKGEYVGLPDWVAVMPNGD